MSWKIAVSKSYSTSSINSFQWLHLDRPLSVSTVSAISVLFDILSIEQLHQLLTHEVGLVVTIVALKILHCRKISWTLYTRKRASLRYMYIRSTLYTIASLCRTHIKLTSADEDGIHCHVVDTHEARGNEVCDYHQELLEQSNNVNEPHTCTSVSYTHLTLPTIYSV